MAGDYKTAYGLDISAGRLVLARAVGRGAPQTVLAAALDSEEARRALEAAGREVARGSAALAVCAPAVQTVVRRLRAGPRRPGRRANLPGQDFAAAQSLQTGRRRITSVPPAGSGTGRTS